MIGHGVVGARVAGALDGGEVVGAVLAGIAVRHDHHDLPAPAVSVSELVSLSDVVVEAAGQEALRVHGAAVLEAGRDLVAISVGALGDPVVRRRILAAGPGRLVVASGAIGGLSLLRAAERLGGFAEVALTTTKRPSVLVQDWMPADLVEQLDSATGPITVFEGSAAEAAVRFPASVNVAATLAMAFDGWDAVVVRVIADPSAEVTTHVIEARGPAGRYRFEIGNRPSAANPATSAVVAESVIVALADHYGRQPVVG